jgi:hypothetical protein
VYQSIGAKKAIGHLLDTFFQKSFTLFFLNFKYFFDYMIFFIFSIFKLKNIIMFVKLFYFILRKIYDKIILYLKILEINKNI